MLFWHLLGRENAHIRSSMLRFSLGRSFKIAIVIQFLGGCWVVDVNYLSSAAGVGGAHSALRRRRYKLKLEEANPSAQWAPPLKQEMSLGRIFNLSNFPNFPKLLISPAYSFIKTNNQKTIATIRKGINFVPAEVKNTTKYECARC